MKIVKVGHKNATTFVHIEEEKAGDVVKTTLESDQPPNPEFTSALADLGKYMCGMMDFPDEWKAKHRCNSISIGYEEDDRIHAVVTLYVELEKFPSGVVINTPCLLEKVAGKAGGGTFMPPKMLDLVKEVIAEGQKYYDGDRAQQTLSVKIGDE